MNSTNNNKRILKNTIFLYFRMILTLGVTLYTSRIVLSTLGVEDFGLYNVIGGVVTMLAFLSGAMSSATQRFFSFELGKKNKGRLENIFNMSINIHILIILIVVLLAETVGTWFIHNYLVIPVERLEAANIVFHCALLSFCISILSVPYNAMIIAYEKMSAFAYVSIVDVLLKLTAVILLSNYGDDKLELYAILLAIISVIVFSFYYLYCRFNFSVTRYKWYWDASLFKTLVSYTGWNLFGNLAFVISNQGLNILLNMFFGATVNAARAIAFQVSSALSSFVFSFQMALNPQIIKSYADSNHQYMLQLVFSGARYSFFLLYMLAIPLLLHTRLILDLWLGRIPEYATEFTQLVIIDALVISLSGTLMTAFQATGKIKKYQLVVGTIILVNLPVSILLLKLGFDAVIVLMMAVVISFCALFARIFLLSQIFEGIHSRFFELITRVALVVVGSLMIYLLAGGGSN